MAHMELNVQVLQHRRRLSIDEGGLAYGTPENPLSTLWVEHELSALIRRNAPLPQMRKQLATDYFLDGNKPKLKIVVDTYEREL